MRGVAGEGLSRAGALHRRAAAPAKTGTAGDSKIARANRGGPPCAVYETSFGSAAAANFVPTEHGAEMLRSRSCAMGTYMMDVP